MIRRLLLLLAASGLLLAACAPATRAPSPTAAPAASRPAAAAPTAGPKTSAAGEAAKPAQAAAPKAAEARAADQAAAPQLGQPALAPSNGGAGPAVAQAAQPKLAEPKPAPTATSGGAQAPDLPQLSQAGRMIVYNSELTLLVKSVDEAVRAIGDIAASQGGYVAAVDNGTEQSLPVSTIRIKVLPDRYQETMSRLRGLAIEVAGEKATTQDVTEEYDDVQTQLASLEATHRQLLELLSRATTVEEVLRIQQQANQVKLQIDRLRGRATVLERLSELATIAVQVRPAEAFLGREYAQVRGQLRQAQSAQAAQLVALKRARTPEEEAAIRDKLGELALQIERAQARLKEIEQKASQAGLALPTLPAEETAQTAPADEQLQQSYLTARIQLRQAEARQADLTRRLKAPLPPDEATALREQLTSTLLEINRLQGQLKSIQERAQQTGTVLPQLTPEQEAVLAGTTAETPQADPLRAAAQAWEASLSFVRAALAGLVGALVFLWWAIPLLAVLAYLGRGWLRRRALRTAPPAPEAPAP